MDFVILIPTYNNFNLFKKYTYKFILKHNLQDKCILLIQSDEDESKYNALNLPMRRTPQGKGASISFMMQQLPIDTNIVCIDDDVSKMVDEEERELTEVKQLFIEMFKRLDKEKLTLGGFYPVGKKFYMKPRESVITHLSFIVGSMFLFKNKRIALEEGGKTDYIFTIDNYVYAGGVLRYNHAAPIYKYKANLEYDEDLDVFIKKYGEYVKYVRKLKNNKTSIILKTHI